MLKRGVLLKEGETLYRWNERLFVLEEGEVHSMDDVDSPTRLTHTLHPGAVINASAMMCLAPARGEDAKGIYVIDPEFNGETGNAWKDHAQIKLIFDMQPVNGEVRREIQGGHRGERAWRVVRRD